MMVRGEGGHVGLTELNRRSAASRGRARGGAVIAERQDVIESPHPLGKGVSAGW